jgi:putative tricarboxylic transport membrane protein
MSDVVQGVLSVLQWHTVMASAVGCALGIVAGALPGITISMGLVLLLPVTFGLDPSTAMSLLIGVYTGGMTGGSISAILLNIPGTPSAVMTGIDGHEMARRGQGGKAIGIAIWSSFIGGWVGWAALVLLAPVLARVALSFGAPELFALMLLGMTVICSFSEGSIVKGLLAGVVGLLIMTVGMDPVVGIERFTFGHVELQAGISFLAAMIGLFAIPQVILGLRSGDSRPPLAFDIPFREMLPSRAELRRILKPSLWAGAIGTAVGIVPGTGGAIAAVLAYDHARRMSTAPEEFGKGAPEGVAAPEAANDGVTGGALIPTLTLGIPGDPPTAVLLGALVIQGLYAGPLLFEKNPAVVYGILTTFAVAKFWTVILTLLGIKAFVQVLRVPASMLLPVVAALTVVGSYAIRNSVFDCFVMAGLGILGYFFTQWRFPLMPIVLALVLGPPLEEHLRTSLVLSGGDFSTFVRRPVSAVLLVLAVVMVATQLPWRRWVRADAPVAAGSSSGGRP